MSPFQSLREYELFVYALVDQFPRLLRSTLVVVQRGRYFAELTGEVLFPDGYRLNVYERLSWDAGPLTIEGYSYEVWRGSEELYWYDSQPHPNDPALASTDPHHKHVPPDIKHHRAPAPGLNFTEPNLPFLIREMESAFFKN
jgi:hypothetical protein